MDCDDLINASEDNVCALLAILQNIGRIKDKNIDSIGLVALTKHKNAKVRALALKNLSKLEDIKLLPLFFDIAQKDANTSVATQATSAIGRLKNKEAIPFLKELLKKHDPKIIVQAIRGLLVFKGESLVDASLKELKDHSNETIKALIKKEYFAQNKDKLKEKTQVMPHALTYPYLIDVAVNADTKEVLKLLKTESLHLTFTSPPYYNARDYSIYSSYKEYLDFLEEVFQEVYRVTKEGRFLIVNTSPVIIPRIGRKYQSHRYPIPFDLHARLTNIGWQFIDDIVWEKSEYSVKNRIGGFMQHRKPLAYKPNSITEYLMVYRKKTDRLLDYNIRQYSKEVIQESLVKGDFETTTVWKVCPKSDRVHSAVFPEELCKRVIEYYSYKGDLIFDPFAGSGTVARVAKKLGRNFFITEKESTYFDYIKEQIETRDLFQNKCYKFFTLEGFKETLE